MKIYRYASTAARKKLERIINRGTDYSRKNYQQVEAIIRDLRANQHAALEKYTRRFDAPSLTADRFKVTRDEMTAAAGQVDKSFSRALNRAARQITAFHQEQKSASWFNTPRPGVLVGQRVTPVESAGIYVPGARGGETPLVSTVLMGAIPAKTAGVPRVAMVTPPRSDGSVSPHLLVAARKVGVDEIYKVGSAWAIAALACGTATIPRVDMIAGPGNLYVALAKRILAGTVGIDILAGPSEILIIADASADPAHLAADLLSQAEHDELSAAVLITPDEAVAEKTAVEIERQLDRLKRKTTAEKALAGYGGLFVVDGLKTAFELANRFAPEHLELQIENPFDWLEAVRNAGAVFLGGYTPEPVGDYVAGPNHTLPTAGSARFSSALSTSDFMKKTSIVRYTAAALRREAADVICLAETEGLDAHAHAVRARLDKK
ncbi:MAG: histidinol dehydrogenase [Desulfosudaceae bacterium]